MHSENYFITFFNYIDEINYLCPFSYEKLIFPLARVDIFESEHLLFKSAASFAKIVEISLCNLVSFRREAFCNLSHVFLVFSFVNLKFDLYIKIHLKLKRIDILIDLSLRPRVCWAVSQNC